jgi:integral membrane protein (TIGR01906 family)
MRDVRGVFAEFYGLAILAGVVLVALVVRAYRAGRPAAAWHAVAAGMRWLIVGVVVAGVIATFFFDQAFEVFHELFFPSGSYTFDPLTDRLVQLFPFDFWSETTLVLGAAIIVVAAVSWAVARRLARPAAAAAGAIASPSMPSTERAG